MSYTVVNPGGARSRPTTVTAASALLYVAAAVSLISIAFSLLSLGPIQDVLTSQFQDTPEANTVATAMRVGIIFAVVLNALFVTGTIVVAVLDSRGKNPARIVTWVLGGIVVLCNVCGLVSSAFTNSLSGLGGNDPQSAEIQRRIEDAIPSWQTAVDSISSVLLILAWAGAMILLGLPASNAFFRKEQEVWVPPTYPGGGGYPPAGGPQDQYPGGAGGYPPATGQPGQDQYPPPGQYPQFPGQYPPPDPGLAPPPPPGPSQ
jgi:hypothetical protein